MLGSQAGYYQDYARREARAAGLPEEFVVALFDTESNWNPQATSPKNARGIAQFIPATGSRYGLKTEEDFYNPEKSMSAGVRHLKDLYDKYEGDLEKTAAAYNAGSGAVDRYGGMPPYKETRNYWNRIQRKMGETDTSSVPPSLSRNASMNGQNPLNLDPGAIGLLMGQDVTLEPVASPEPTVAQRLATDPWLQMGLGILSARTGSGMGNIASGMQQGLLAAQQGELSSQKIRNQAVQNEQNRRDQQLLRQAQLQNAVRLMGGQAMNPWEQHQREQALYRRQQDVREAARTRNDPVMLQHEDTEEKVLAAWDRDTGQYRRITREGVGEALDSTKYFRIKESGGRGGAEPTVAERKAAEKKEELTVAADLGDELITLVQENPWVAGSIGQDIGAAGGYARQIGHQLTRKGADTLGWVATKVGDYLSPEEDQKVRAQFNTKAGLYIKAVRKLASAEQGAVMSEGDINRLNQVTQLKAPDGTDITIVEALKTIKDLLEARGITNITDWQNKLIREGNIEEPLINVTGGETLPPSGTASPPQANGRKVFTTEGGVQYWAE